MKDGDALSLALEAAAWIHRSAVRSPEGTRWATAPADSSEACDDLYSGGAGVVAFLLALYAATGDQEARSEVHAAVPMLARAAQELPPGLYTGAAGIAAVLTEVHRMTASAEARAGALAVLDRLAQEAETVGEGVQWTDSTDVISGSAGIGLALLALGAGLRAPEAVDLAVAAGHRLVERAEVSPAGVHWRESPDEPRLMPNFAHGTAGVAFFLARLAHATGEGAFLDSAVAAARTLLEMANDSEGGLLICHHVPGGEGLFYRGWCHGPVGTARLFITLHHVTGDREWLDATLRCACSIADAGVPVASAPGFWNNVGLCCGSAGAADLLLRVYCLTRDERYLRAARLVADDISRCSRITSGGMCWPQAEHRTRPNEVSAQTGLMQGAAGVGTVMLHLEAVEHDSGPVVNLPDDPWPMVLER